LIFPLFLWGKYFSTYSLSFGKQEIADIAITSFIFGIDYEPSAFQGFILKRKGKYNPKYKLT
ncbi:hypothetical protein P9386_06425, partial [Caldifermentibacillus hisashii]|uniref:hypothetical protein n=1 Tax=Caldifermentibacillus hisashii TaxID=996558 RepID=UPI002E1EB46C|nr:hypothetical protein [Caldifermentibacillus hisashii]